MYLHSDTCIYTVTPAFIQWHIYLFIYFRGLLYQKKCVTVQSKYYEINQSDPWKILYINWPINHFGKYFIGIFFLNNMY